MVTVTEIDIQRKRIALSMKDNAVTAVQTSNPSKVQTNKKGKVVPPAKDFASQLESLKGKFN